MKKLFLYMCIHSDTHNSRQVNTALRAETFLAFQKLAGRGVKNAYTKMLLLYTYRSIQLCCHTSELGEHTWCFSYFLIWINHIVESSLSLSLNNSNATASLHLAPLKWGERKENTFTLGQIYIDMQGTKAVAKKAAFIYITACFCPFPKVGNRFH